MTPDRLKAAKAACKAATDPPWESEGFTVSIPAKEGTFCFRTQPQDAAFIALSRTALPAALEFIEELLWELFRHTAVLFTEGAKEGWWGSIGIAAAHVSGDKLVALGRLEKHSDECGDGHWFYRPIEQEKPHD